MQVFSVEPYERDGTTLRKDSKNPSASQRNRALLHAVILTDFEYSDGKWKGGEIYGPKSGKTYSCLVVPPIFPPVK